MPSKTLVLGVFLKPPHVCLSICRSFKISCKRISTLNAQGILIKILLEGKAVYADVDDGLYLLSQHFKKRYSNLVFYTLTPRKRNFS